ncbi:MAG: hypothetical protein M5U27_02530 [Gaiella sp.]|nr:hypothetical protein [Gaiella sp.]
MRRVRVEADRLDAVPECRPVEDRPVDDERAQGDEEADVEALEEGVAPEDMELRTFDDVVRDRNGLLRVVLERPPSPKRNIPIQSTVQLSMMVEITSCAPTVALRKPAIPPSSPPISVPITSTRITCRYGFMPSKDEPTQTARIAPARYCPWPPMLNSPQRNANATASPTRISVVVWMSVCWRLNAAVESGSHGIWKNQLSPEPSKIARYVSSGFFPRRDEHDEAAHHERDQHRQERREQPRRHAGRGQAVARTSRAPRPAEAPAGRTAVR